MNRRRFLRYGSGITLSLGAMSGLSLAHGAGAERRFVLLILRGGMDGLAAVAPYGDASYRKSRGQLALTESGKKEGVLDLDGMFGLHPAFGNLHTMFRAIQMSVVHAVAPPYQGRSHFDGQDVLEAGYPEPSASATGWLYRALDVLPHTREQPYQNAYALGSSVPLVLRGPQPVGSWAPDRLPDPDKSTMDRLVDLYQEDERLGAKLMASIESDAIAGDMDGRVGNNSLASVAEAAARFLNNAQGPRIAVLDSGGWDTHAGQGGAQGQLANRFRALDRTLSALQSSLGSNWENTVVAVVTEFGRTVAMNGTRGSDHGYAGAAFLLGGAVNGGNVIADWPGLKSSQLHEGRDLRATIDMRSMFAGILRDHMGVDPNAVDEVVFPGLSTGKATGALAGLIKT